MAVGAVVAAREDAGIAYLGHLEEAFELAARAADRVRDARLEIGGHTLRLRFAGASVEHALTAALSHHPRPSGAAAEFTICAFDAAASGVPLPRFPWGPYDVRERGEIRGFNNDRVRTLYESDSAVLSMLDVAGRRAFLAVEDTRRMLWWQRAAPLRTILHWILTTPTRLLVHAAAVGIDGEGVLLAGAGGSGKSTTAVACAAAGLSYAGDDYVLLDTSNTPTVRSLYTTAKLTDESLAMLPSLDHSLWPGSLEDEKRVIDMGCAFPGAIALALRVKAIVLPRVAPGAPTRIAPASAGEALRALAPTTIYQLPSNGGQALAQLAGLARRFPAYSLATGDAPSAASAIAQLIREL